MRRVLILEPYFGGSHQQFIEGLQEYVPAEYLLLSLPARNWQMRMQLSAPWFIQKITELPVAQRSFDTVLCSSFVDAGVLRGLLPQVKGWNHQARVLIYFHENQFVYPSRDNQKTQHLLAGINFHSALAADAVAFNSEYNRQTFLAGVCTGLQAASGMKLTGLSDKLADKSVVLFPGIDFSAIDAGTRKKIGNLPVIVWNHRWEHDKNPQEFFAALDHLIHCGIDFRLLILGQSFTACPACFAHARERLADKIIHFGFVPSRQNYVELLNQGDIVVSTARHEFYGIAVIEAVRAGCVPVLPNRLVYPELFDEQFLYQENFLAQKLENLLADHRRLSQEAAMAMTDCFSWQSVKQQYSQWLLDS